MFAAVFVCLLLFCGNSISLAQEILIESDASTWAAARQKCRERGPTCDLTTHRPQPQLASDVWSSLSPLPAGSSSWIGARVLEQLVWKRGQRPLIEDMGCYLISEDVKTQMRSLRRYNGPERCLTLCTTNIIALQDGSCYCLSPDKMAALERRPLASCYRYCSREPYRCGGDHSRISLYKIPDRTLYEKRGKLNTFFWRRSNNNEEEFLVFTNKPGKQKQQFCAAPDGSYSTAKLKAPCPDGGQSMSFEGVDVGQFVANISSMRDWDPLSFLLPLGYSRKMLWLDGEAVSTSGGKGPCVAITFDGQRYSLVKKPCKTRLTSACSCYTEPTTTEATTMELVTTTTTTTLAPETTTTTTPEPTTTPEATSTTTEPSSTTTETTSTTTTKPPSTTTEASSTTTTEATSTTTETTTSTTMTYDLSSETSTMIIETTTVPPSTMTDGGSEDLSSTDEAETFAPWKTMKNAAGESTTSSWAETTSSALVTEEDASSVSVGVKKAELQPDEKTNSQLLFPFSDMKEGDSPSHIAPPSVSQEESTADDGSPATAAASIEMIVGISVAVVALMLILIIVVIAVKRRKQKSTASLLKAKKPATERGASYPI